MLNKQEQSQIAGNNSTQIQIENYHEGVTASSVVSIASSVFKEMFMHTANEYAESAMCTVKERVDGFANELFPRLEKVEGALAQFKDPKFEFLLRDAQISSAQTDSKDDWTLLSELLIHYVEKKNDRLVESAICQAVKIVSSIDSDALRAMTVLYILLRYIPQSSKIDKGLKLMDEAIGKCMEYPLPNGFDWMDHLDVLGAIRLSPIGTLQKTEEFLAKRYRGYACVGIKKDSKEYQKAIEILGEYRVNETVLVDNVCLDGYVRLNIYSIEYSAALNKDMVRQILGLYSKDINLGNVAKANFFRIWDSYETLKKVREWWDLIPAVFEFTSVGNVIAQANACRVVPTLPNLLKK